MKDYERVVEWLTRNEGRTAEVVFEYSPDDAPAEVHSGRWKVTRPKDNYILGPGTFWWELPEELGGRVSLAEHYPCGVAIDADCLQYRQWANREERSASDEVKPFLRWLPDSVGATYSKAITVRLLRP